MLMREWYIYSRPWSVAGPDCMRSSRMTCTDIDDSFRKIEIDSKQQKSLTIPDGWTTRDITSAYQYGSSFEKIKTLHVVLTGIETTFLPARIQKFIYSNKIKTKMNQSTNIEVRGNYHDNTCGTSQEEIYNLDLWIFPMDNKIEEPVFTFECIVIQ
ncbi:unnamed protein product [Adineta steineri]|uniref:Uncharacterized protein n=1 Tax=Adineta steineri TaxID=433720 RepID=A0A814MBT1_9BILA|nr:unnamed protein product [Adineta steineri]CAF1077213.1 unnamed protein product [Adineta steineri]CAF1438881.1 unnamed protein product [Adineta steineri]